MIPQSYWTNTKYDEDHPVKTGRAEPIRIQFGTKFETSNITPVLNLYANRTGGLQNALSRLHSRLKDDQSS